jgi:hypothetical protein
MLRERKPLGKSKKESQMENDHGNISNYFTALADMLMLPASEFRSALDATNKIWDKAKSEKIRKQESLIRQEGFHRRLIREYYDSNRDGSKFHQYNILLSNQRYSSAIYTTSNRVGLALPLSEIETNYVPPVAEPKNTKRISQTIKNQVTNVTNKFRQLGIRIWDQDLYRMVADPFVGDKPKLSFSLSRYLNYRFSAGLLEDELFDTLLANESDISYILNERTKNLPIRNEVLPTLKTLSYLSERISAGGIACVVAMARGAPYNDYCIPLQLRSQSVAEGRGVYTASIQAWHQPIVGDHKHETNLYWTVLREMAEELYGEEEVVEESPHLRHDWYLEKYPGINYIHNNPDKISFEFLGIGMNALLGTYDCAILLAIHDPEFWYKYSSPMKKNWENKNWLQVSTADNIMSSLERVFNIGWFDQGMFSLSQGLLRLKQLDEKRVPNLDVGFELS